MFIFGHSRYTNYEQLYRKMQCFNGMSEHITDADHIWISTEEVIAFEEVMRWVSSGSLVGPPISYIS